MLSSSSSPFGQSSSSPFGSLSEFGQTCSASNNPFAPMPFGFGSQFGGTSTGVFGSLTRSGTSTGAQSTIFRSTAAFMDQQCGSSMVAEPYVTTRESDGGGKLVSISAMPAYKDKSHEELRWEASEKLLSISAMPAYEEKSHEQIRWEYYHQLGDKGASSVFRQTSSPSISNPSNFAPASTNTTSTFNLPPLISNPSSFDPASTSTTFKFNPRAPSAAPTVPDDGTSSQMGFNEAAPPSVSVPFSSLPIQNNYGQFPATRSPAAVQPVQLVPATQPVQLVPATNPFGTLPPVPQMSIGCGEMIQYGISSMPVVDKPAAAPVRVSHLLSFRHLTKRRVVRLPARNYNPKNDGPRIPFFIN